MPRKVNQRRLYNTNLMIVLSFLITAYLPQVNRYGNDNPHEIIEFIGLLLAITAALGRMYCTAFLGGFKNKKVMDYGPFSVCRNPLYFFSLTGVIGISLITVNFIVILILPLAIFLIYRSLIHREEAHLTTKFGEIYLAYKAKTPSLLPNFKLYHAPQTIEMTPRTFLNAFRDSAIWILAFPVCETIEYLQDKGIITPLLTIRLF